MGCFKSLVGILMLYLCNLNKKVINKRGIWTFLYGVVLETPIIWKNDVVSQYIFVLLAEKKKRYIPCLYRVCLYVF